MTNLIKKVADYITEAKRRGYNKELMRAQLLKAGWSEEIIERHLSGKKRTGTRGRSVPKRKGSHTYLTLVEVLDDIATEFFETSERISVIAELCLETITSVSYDAARGEVIVHADRAYSIPLPLEGINTGTLEWSYNNGVLEMLFDKEGEQ